MEPSAKIPVLSHKQAMDWSLVLVSQGIETEIHGPPEQEEWWLEVATETEAAALEAIRRYRFENRRWMWRKEFPLPGVVFDWAALCWVALIAAFFWAQTEVPGFEAAGVMDTAALGGGQWWRPFTAVWLHADLGHLASNASIGVLLLGLTLGLYGTGLGILAAYLAGVGGNLVAWLAAFDTHRSLGASGLVMGCIGLLAAQALFTRGPRRIKLLLTSVIGGLLLFVLLGLAPGTDVVAHSGGAASGFALGCVLAMAGSKPESSRANIVAGLAFLALVILPWVFAIKA